MLTFVIVLAVVAGLSVVGTVAYAVAARRRAAQPPAQAFVQQVARPYNPGRDLIEYADQTGLEAAGHMLTSKIAENRANQKMQEFAQTFLPPTPAPQVPK